MASIARDKNGCRRILFVAPDGKRPTIRLGKVSQRAAEAVKFRVEQLLAARLPGLLPPLSPAEALEVTMIHSLAGQLSEGKLLRARPFRAASITAPSREASCSALLRW